jgi:AAA domain-containing protein
VTHLGDGDEVTPSQRLLSAILYHPSQLRDVAWVTPDMFVNPHEGVLWAVLTERIHAGSHDLLIEMIEIVTRLPPVQQLVWRSVAADVAPPGTAGYYAGRVAADSVKARMMVAADRARTLAAEVDPDVLPARMREFWDEVLGGMVTGPQPVRSLPVDEFLAAADSGEDWLIPGVLQRRERMLVAAPPKAGKSFLTRQIAVCLAAGRHPFDPKRDVQPRRVLLVDLENPAPPLRMALRRITGGFRFPSQNLRILHLEEGLDLGEARDRAFLDAEIGHAEPDLVVLAPIYKTYAPHGDESWDQQARGVQRPLDVLRVRHDCAFLMEHHQSKGDQDGLFGSNMWNWWLDLRVVLQPEDGARPPFKKLLWRAMYRDARRAAPVSIRWAALSQPVPWEVTWGDEGGLDLALDAVR